MWFYECDNFYIAGTQQQPTIGASHSVPVVKSNHIRTTEWTSHFFSRVFRLLRNWGIYWKHRRISIEDQLSVVVVVLAVRRKNTWPGRPYQLDRESHRPAELKRWDAVVNKGRDIIIRAEQGDKHSNYLTDWLTGWWEGFGSGGHFVQRYCVVAD